MAEPDHWHPSAAYLYVLHLDAPALAWEYLRRHPDYRRDWSRHRHHPAVAQHWGLRMLEDPSLDAREAHPAWFPDHEAVVQLYPDVDPPADAQRFEFWHLPGRKHLIHDGRRLVLATRWANCCVHLAFAPDLEEGMAYAYAVRAASDPCLPCRVLMGELSTLAAGVTPTTMASPRPTATALLELRTLQALDGSLVGASLRSVAGVLFGAETVARDWHADGALRARVRRLVCRGRALMQSGYRELVQISVAKQGRSPSPAQRP